MTFRTATIALFITMLFISPCLAQHEPTIISEGTPVDDTCWWAYRLTPSGGVDRFFFSTAYEGSYTGIFDTANGDVLYYSLQVPTEEQINPPEEGSVTFEQPLLIDGDTYYVARSPEGGSLFVRQIEKGEIWLFRVGETMFFKKTPFVFGGPAKELSIELSNEDGELINSTRIAVMDWQLAEARSGYTQESTRTLIRFIGRASCAEEFPVSEIPDRGQWQEYDLENLGVVQIWSKDPFASSKVTVRAMDAAGDL